MIWIAILLGAIVGVAMLSSPAGLLIGGLLGYLIGETSGLKARLAALERAIKESGLAPDRSTPQHAPSDAATVAATSEAVSDAVSLPAQPDTTLSVPVARIAAEAPPTAPTATLVDRAMDAVREFFMGGNTVVRIGVVILFFGVAFLLKYAAERAVFPIELRLSATALGAIVLLYVGARLRRTREGYGLTLEGGAVGILYLTIFAALRLYDLLPVSLAFGLLVVVCAATAALALLQNSLALAALGAAGGFLAPILASTGLGSHVALFSYYALLNAGIVFIAWFKAWRLLNLLGFGFTFVIGSLWGYRYYQPEFFTTTEPFLVLFFLLYVAIAVLFARRRSPALKDPVDGTLIFGVPIVAGLLQAALVKSFEYGMAWSAFALGAFYLALAWSVLRWGMAPLLAEAFLALGVIFTTLTIPLAVDGHWTAAAWAIEGAGILWVGRRQSRVLAQWFGLGIQFAAGVFFLSESQSVVGYAIVNSIFVGCVLLGLAGLTSAFLLSRLSAKHIGDGFWAPVMLAWGLIWWFGGVFNEVVDHVPRGYVIAVWLALIGVTTLIQDRVAQTMRWQALRTAALFNLALLLAVFAWAAASVSHPFGYLGYVGWAIAITAYYWVLRRTDGVAPLQAVWHLGALWLAFALLGWEVHWTVAQWLPNSDWSIAALGLVFAATLSVLALLAAEIWPIRGNRRTYRLVGATPLALLAIVWLIAVVMQSGNPAPLRYVPLLNPLDVSALFVLLALVVWIAKIQDMTPWPPAPMYGGIGLVAFAWVNAAVFRALHHLAHIPYQLRTMLDSMLVQATLSLFWTTLAFTLMLLARRARRRYLWIMGAALLGIVVVKLFIVDLSNTGTIERIVSFVGVGVLLLVIGYLAPLPPATAAEKRA